MVAAQTKGTAETEFKRIIQQYTDGRTADSLWQEAAALYSGPKRHYHTLAHIDNYYAQLLKCKELVKDWESLVVAMVYHDAIYHSPDNRNEERSAELAVERLKATRFPKERIAFVDKLIMATKAHGESEDMDINLFNDADMSILGLQRDIYAKYVKDVRLEYGDTPAFDAGRKRVLNYFLQMKAIFKTPFFHQRYEQSARDNIAWEIASIK
jgi:predicted metal-dependent HD superfamily phosphohydrolase